MALDTVVCAHHEHGAVHGRKHAFRLGREVDVPGRVDERDGAARVLELGLSGKDRDAALPLHGVGVEHGVAAVNAAQLTGAAGVVEQRLRERGLSCVDVCEQPYDHKASWDGRIWRL